MTKQINVGFNGSASSSEAVLWAAAEASVRGARLRIISCSPTSAVPAMFGRTASEQCTSALEQADGGLTRIQAAVAASHPDLLVTTLATVDPAESVLVDGVDEDDLVVVGTRNHHVAADSWLGSTARHVVRHSGCPVVVVPGPGSWERTDRIVVGVDGSAASKQALQWAGDEADRHGAKLLVVHGWLYPYVHAVSTSSRARDLTRVDASCLLDREMETARSQFATEVGGRLIEGSPVAALLGAVRHGDLLVLGSHGYGAIRTKLFGSVVDGVLDRCIVPTVVVRSAD
jgi:nucleotide-binding universal stress UspA family protein